MNLLRKLDTLIEERGGDFYMVVALIAIVSLCVCMAADCIVRAIACM